jgi:hypothetical protein
MLACPSLQLLAQRSFLDTSDAYLGQAPPSDNRGSFAPGPLAESGTFVMGRVAFSHDGKEFYYTQNDSWESGKHTRLKMIAMWTTIRRCDLFTFGHDFKILT